MDRKYLVQFGGAMLAYVLVLFASIWMVDVASGAWWGYVVAPLPMIPMVFLLLAFMGALGRMDELQRRVQLEGLSFAFGGTALLTFGYGFMQIVGFPQVSWFFVWPIMAVLWIVGLGVSRRRYQ